MSNASKLQELLAKARARAKEAETKQAISQLETAAVKENITDIDLTVAGVSSEALNTEEGQDAAVDIIVDVLTSTVLHGKQGTGVSAEIILNKAQQASHDAILAGEDVVIIGAAGTGKTTSIRKATQSLLATPDRLPIFSGGSKHLKLNSPGAAIVSFTRKAVNNIRHAVVDELKENTITIHKLLEFGPVFYETVDPANPGSFKKTMQFVPGKNEANPLPSSLALIIYEESSMIGVELYKLVQKAMPHPHQEVFLGDIQQLPPVFGLAILGFKMVELKVIEYTEVYRQALQSPILDFAWKLLAGDPKPLSSVIERFKTEEGKPRLRVPAYDALSKTVYNEDGSLLGRLLIQPWQKKLEVDTALATIVKQLSIWADTGYYNPEEDIIICPFNKAFGTIELNLSISQFLGIKRQAIVHEVIAGFNKHYLAVGDRVLYDKEDAVITSIRRNGTYLGAATIPASVNLNRWGHLVAQLTAADLDRDEQEHYNSVMAAGLADEDDFLNQSISTIENRVTSASHIIEIELIYSGEKEVLETAAAVNALLGGYAITVHKSQGSEYDNGFILLHHTHATMLSRELVYTGATRFKKSLHILCETDSLEKAVKSQRIRGNTLEQKKELFKGKQLAGSAFNIEDTYKNGGDYVVTRYSPVNATGRNEIRYEEPEVEPEVAPIKVSVPEPVNKPLSKLEMLRAKAKLLAVKAG